MLMCFQPEIISKHLHLITINSSKKSELNKHLVKIEATFYDTLFLELTHYILHHTMFHLPYINL